MKNTTTFVYGMLLIGGLHDVIHFEGFRFYFGILLSVYILWRICPILIDEWYYSNDKNEKEDE